MDARIGHLECDIGQRPAISSKLPDNVAIKEKGSRGINLWNVENRCCSNYVPDLVDICLSCCNGDVPSDGKSHLYTTQQALVTGVFYSNQPGDNVLCPDVLVAYLWQIAHEIIL